MLLLSIKTQFLLWEKEESRRFTSSILEFRDWSSELKMIEETATSMDGCSALILSTKPATLFFIFFGWSIFKLLVTTCRIIFFGFRLITGFAKSTISSMVAPEKEKALTFWVSWQFLTNDVFGNGITDSNHIWRFVLILFTLACDFVTRGDTLVPSRIFLLLWLHRFPRFGGLLFVI